MRIWLIYAGILLYMEVVYHIGNFGLSVPRPWIALCLISVLAGIQALITGWIEQNHKRKCFWIFVIPEFLIFAVETVYFTIFRQALQVRAVIMGGQDALTGFWRETLLGIGKASPVLIFLVLPLLAAVWFFYGKKKQLPVFDSIRKVRTAFLLGVSLLACWMTLEIGGILETDYYEEYTEFYDPTLVLENMGVTTLVQRDIWYELELLAGQVQEGISHEDSDVAEEQEEMTSDNREEVFPGDVNQEESGEGMREEGLPEESTEDILNNGAGSEDDILDESSGEVTENVPEEEPLPPHNIVELDLEKLRSLSAGDKEKEWLAEYFAGEEPTGTNAYTGMFEGYNLIYITAEGFSTYAIDEELTPTLYKLAHSGFVCSEYYVPLWQTSTSDGEYVNLTGMIPDGQFSMKKTASNNMAYSLPRFFDGESCVNMAYHNNTLSYYDRHLSHPNLGYVYRASKLGELSEEEWGDHIFYMENPGRWPSSDLEMIQYTLPEYIGADRFHVYYMTISGHMYYSFKGNSMSSKNREAVAGLNMSENARAYIACNIELDKALEHLLAELEKAGKLENTVIAMSADHYPYAMTEEQYEELAGKDLSEGKDLYRNTLILWNAGMKESVQIEKTCGAMDLLPTLLNLFGFDYDSRMYAGRDILSDAEGLVIFNDRSFVTDTVVYDRKKKTTIWKKEMTEEAQEQYLNEVKQEVKERYDFSAYMLREDYYDLLKQCEIQ